MYCVITDAYGNRVTTETVTLSIGSPSGPRILSQPADTAVAEAGEMATISVAAEGDGLQYCWYHMNPGQTRFYKTGMDTAEISIQVTKARDGRQMYCVVTDAYGNIVTSDTATISIIQ